MTTEITLNRTITPTTQVQKETNILNKEKIKFETKTTEEKNINTDSKNQTNTNVLKVNDAEANLLSFDNPKKNDTDIKDKSDEIKSENLSSIVFKDPNERISFTQNNLLGIIAELKSSNKEGNLRLAKLLEDKLSVFSNKTTSDSEKIILSMTLTNIIRDLSDSRCTPETKEKKVKESFQQLNNTLSTLDKPNVSKAEIEKSLTELGGYYDDKSKIILNRDLELIYLDSKVKDSLNQFTNSSNNIDKTASQLIQKILTQSESLSHTDKVSVLRDVVNALDKNKTGNEKIELLRERIEENNINKDLVSDNTINTDTLSKLEQKSALVTRDIIYRARSGKLSFQDRQRLIESINDKLKATNISPELKNELRVELEKLESLNTQLQTAETELSHSRVGLMGKSRELRSEIDRLREKSPELAAMLEKTLDMVENSNTDASMRLRFIFLCKVQDIISGSGSVESKMERLSKAEKNYTNLVKHIQNIASDPNINRQDARKQIIALMKNYSGESGLFGRRIKPEMLSIIDSTANVAILAVRGGASGALKGTGDGSSEEGGVFRTSVTPTIHQASNNFGSFAENNDTHEESVAALAVDNQNQLHENLLETASITPDVSASIATVIETGRREPQKIEEACNYWRENNSFDQYVVASNNMFKAEDKVNEIKESFSQALETIEMKYEYSNKLLDVDNGSKYLNEEVSSLIENANLLEMQIIDDFTLDPDSEMSDLLKKFRDIISDLDIQTRESIAKKDLKVKIDRDFLRKVKENKDHQEKLDMRREEMKKEFDLLKVKAMQGLD